MRKIILAIGCALAFVASPVLAEDGVGAEYMVMKHSGNAAAAEPFLTGLALLHNFEYDRAAAAFRQAQAADPGFVMAYWGEAMTYNHPLWEEQDRDKALAALAKLGATPAERATRARTPREVMWLDAVETLYGDGSKTDRDFAYLAKMRALFDADPSDIDARAFTGLAILGSSHGGRQIPIYMKAAGLLEVGFITNDHHPGILHYLIHSYDDPVHAPLGERAAERYALVAPDAGHAQHMVSHIFHALGDWPASERANINADAVVDRQRIAEGREPAFCGHYNEWLVYALIQQGKDASTIVDGCRKQALAAVAKGGERRLGGGPASSYGSIALWNGVTGGHWPEPVDGTGDAFLLMRFDLATARLLASFGHEDAVAAALADLRRLKDEIATALPVDDPLNTYTVPWMERQLAQGDALLALSQGRTEEGLAMLELAAEAEDALPEEFGPPAIAKPSYELLGEQLLALGRKGEAAEAFARSLAFAPGRKLSLEGLARAQSR
jgi:tetratricopeptide (TPR) repeat protein